MKRRPAAGVVRMATPAARAFLLPFVFLLCSSAVSGAVVRFDHAEKAGPGSINTTLGVVQLNALNRREQVLPTMGELKRDASRMTSKLNNLAAVPARVVSDMKRQFWEFFPGLSFQYSTFMSCAFTVGLGLTWLIIYLAFFYENDRAEHLNRWEKQLKALEGVDKEDFGKFNPDLIIVMHHPTFTTEDDRKDVSVDDLNRVLNQKPETEQFFPLLAEKKRSAGEGGLEGMRRRASAMSHKLKRKRTEMMQSRAGSSQASEEAPPHAGLTMKETRTALLKDLFAFLTGRGFNVTAFSSIDNDEIFICATLRRRKWIKHYLKRDHRPLRLRNEVVAKLMDEDKAVVQDPLDPACSPPFIPYDNAIIKALTPDDGPKERENAIYRTFRHAGRELVVSSRECCQIAIQEMSDYLNLDAAVELGMAVGWFPVHSKEDALKLSAIWASWSAIKDLTFVQPVSYLREYFGARIAFFFAWNGLHCKALVILVMISGLWMIAILFSKHVLGSDFLNDRQVIGLCIIVSMWSKITNNMWKREERFFGQLWGLTTAESDQPSMMRPSFKGELVPSPLNANIMEVQYPRNKLIMRRLLTGSVTVMFCTIVCVVIWTWMLMFKGRMGKVSATILALMVKVFQFIFQYLVRAMVDYENHKYHIDWFNSYLGKLFVFEYVNNYSAFFFLTISNADRSQCQFAEEECSDRTLEVLRSQVSLTLFVLVICSIAQLIAHIAIIWLKFKWEDHQYRKTFGEEPPERSFHEEQAKLVKIDEANEVQNMMTLVIALGFVLHFGGVSPLALLVSFLVFSVQLRAFAVLLMGTAQRAVPQKAYGIGNWSVIVDFLMTSGVLYTGFLFVAYGYALKGAPIFTRTTSFACFCFAIFFAWILVDMLFPGRTDQEDLLVKRRSYITKLVMQEAHKKDLDDDDSGSDEENDLAASISADSWHNVCGRGKTPRADPLRAIEEEAV